MIIDNDTDSLFFNIKICQRELSEKNQQMRKANDPEGNECISGTFDVAASPGLSNAHTHWLLPHSS